MLVPVPALELREPLKRADGDVVSLEDSGYRLTVFAQHLKQQAKQRILDFLHADGQCLHDQKV